jgi:feruloyl esterase
MKRVAAEVLARCDALDGLADGMVNDMAACGFDPAMVQCPPGAAGDDCLPAAKVAAIRALFNGAHDSHGRALFASWPYDPGIAAPNWRQWKLGTSLTGQSNAQNVTLGLSSLGDVFLTPPETLVPGADADFDAIAARTKASAELINAVSTDLARFRAHGGKLVIVQGAADPVFSAHRLRAWYEAVRGRGGASDYTRLYVVPGMNHCGGGPATDDFDPLTAAVDWVELGRAPERLLARGDAFPGITRPLCPYPSVARYAGGDIADEKSFVCR